MGWGAGSEVADEVWKLVKKFIPKEQKQKIAKKIINIMENQDCDTMDDSNIYTIAHPE